MGEKANREKNPSPPLFWEKGCCVLQLFMAIMFVWSVHVEIPPPPHLLLKKREDVTARWTANGFSERSFYFPNMREIYGKRAKKKPLIDRPPFAAIFFGSRTKKSLHVQDVFVSLVVKSISCESQLPSHPWSDQDGLLGGRQDVLCKTLIMLHADFFFVLGKKGMSPP